MVYKQKASTHSLISSKTHCTAVRWQRVQEGRLLSQRNLRFLHSLQAIMALLLLRPKEKARREAGEKVDLHECPLSHSAWLET